MRHWALENTPDKGVCDKDVMLELLLFFV